MGITGGLVRSVFSRNKSARMQESNVRSGDKKKWTAVRSYLCGDEFNSVLAEEDSASVKSSEATVTQPVHGDSEVREDVQTEIRKEKHNSTSKLFQQEDAAMIIQSSYRNYLARRRSREIELRDDTPELSTVIASPSRESVGTSVEVQTGNSAEVLSINQDNSSFHFQLSKKARTQVFRIKEDWDDSTVSSNVTRMRIKNRLEATNRRERALAYAFAQQLRICSKKKQNRSDEIGTEPNMGWSWLERWMATRVPECSGESHTGKQFEPIDSNHIFAAGKRLFDIAGEDKEQSDSNFNFVAGKRLFDITGEEKESCGSNEVSLQFDSMSVVSENASIKVPKNCKPTKAISRRKTVPSTQCPKEHCKVMKKECQKATSKIKGHN